MEAQRMRNKVLGTLAVAFCAAAIFGCSLNSIIGKWAGSVTVNEPTTNSDITTAYTFEFKSDKTFTCDQTVTAVTPVGTTSKTISESGTYTTKDTTLTMSITTYTVDGVSVEPKSTTLTFTYIRAGDVLTLTPNTSPIPIVLTKG